MKRGRFLFPKTKTKTGCNMLNRGFLVLSLSKDNPHEPSCPFYFSRVQVQGQGRGGRGEGVGEGGDKGKMIKDANARAGGWRQGWGQPGGPVPQRPPRQQGRLHHRASVRAVVGNKLISLPNNREEHPRSASSQGLAPVEESKLVPFYFAISP